MKKILSLLLTICMIIIGGTSIAFADEPDDSNIELISKITNADGSTVIVINENGKELKMTFRLIETNNITPYSSSDMPGGYSLPSDYHNWNWNGWGTPGLSRYNAEAEQSIHAMSETAIAYFLSAYFGAPYNEVLDIAGYIKDAFVPGQTTVWLDRITWVKNNYSTYRRKDYYYTNEARTNLAYEHSIREYVGGNR